MFESEATEEVGAYEELVILSAEQTGANTVLLTFSDDVTALDDIDVFKGSKEAAVDDIDYNDNTAVITLTNKIVSDAEYTVVFTPANGDDASEASFVGEKATLGEIVFLNNVLVMADTTYTKGYAYVKGYDQFGDEIALTGLNVTPGVGTFTGYDIDTGRVTIEDQTGGATGVFLLMKEVPVFAQYQQGNEVISGQATLTVSTQSYVSEVEFGEVAKDGGDMRADGRITLSELGSGKYYVPFETIRDQYGNDLDADTLNTQKNGDAQGNKTLFVIPAANGAFYSTGNFGTIDGQTVLWLEAGANAKPGAMDLTIVGAGGGTFSTPIEIEDDPYIDALTVTYPELYENDAVTDELEFTAIDQYGEEIDLWTFKPTVVNDNAGNPTILQFTDENHMTQIQTNIAATGVQFNKVDLDYTNKKFKVTLKVTGAAKTLATFTATTAGMQVTPVSITIGQRGEGGKVKSALASGTDTQLAPATRGKNSAVNFNKVVGFEDANGREMVRGTSPDYPQFLPTFAVGDVINGYDSKKDYTKFYWTLSSEKIGEDAALTAPEIAAMLLDGNGEYTYAEAENNGYDVYVTLYASELGGSPYYIIDDQDFHLTSVKGNDKTYAVTLKDTLWASTDSNDSVSASVTATTDLGETYAVKGDRLKITSGLFANTNDSLSGALGAGINPASGTENVTVFVNSWTNGALTGSFKPADSVALNYTDAKPVAKSAWAKYYTQSANDGKAVALATALVGKNFDAGFTGTRLTLDGNNSNIAVSADGVMTIVYGTGLGDTITLGVNDNYGNTMSDSKFYLDGTLMPAGNGTIAIGTDHTIEVRNGDQSKMIYVDVENLAVNTTVAKKTAVTVTTAAELKLAEENAKADATTTYTITAGDSFTIDAATEIPANATFVIPSGVVVTSTQVLTVNGSISIAGKFTTSVAGGLTKASAGSLETSGTGAITATGAGTVLAGGTGKVAIGGSGGAAIDTLSTTGAVTISAGTNTITTLNMAGAASTLTLSGGNTTVTTFTAATGTNTIKSGATLTTSATTMSGTTWVLDGGTINAVGLTGANTATIKSTNSASTLNVVAAATLTADQTWTFDHSSTATCIITIADAAIGESPVDPATGYADTDATFVGDEDTDTWTWTAAQ